MRSALMRSSQVRCFVWCTWDDYNYRLGKKPPLNLLSENSLSLKSSAKYTKPDRSVFLNATQINACNEQFT